MPPLPPTKGSTEVPSKRGGTTKNKSNKNKRGNTTQLMLSSSQKMALMNPEERRDHAARIITWYLLRKFPGKTLDRARIVERMNVTLENVLCLGVVRLILFCVMFVLVIVGSSIGSNPDDRRGVQSLLRDSLNIEEFLEIRSVEGLRNFLPTLSSSLREYSVSGSNRFNNPQALEVLREAVVFNGPAVMRSAEISVGSGSFTFAAWVRPPQDEDASLAIMRKPLPSNPSVDCWGWYHPAEFRYGAADYYSTDPDEEDWQVRVKGERGSAEGMRHQAIVFTNGSTVAFFTNGKQVGPILTLPRSFTDCTGNAELGSANLELSSVKVYPRALEPGEISEIFTSGSLISELATGYSLQLVQDGPHTQIEASLEASMRHTSEEARLLNRERQTESVIMASWLANQTTEDTYYPEDHSPHGALLPFQNPSNLPVRERLRWESVSANYNATSRMPATYATDDKGRRYVQLVSDPIYPMTKLESDTWWPPPQALPPDLPVSNSFTITFWIKPLSHERFVVSKLDFSALMLPGTQWSYYLPQFIFVLFSYGQFVTINAGNFGVPTLGPTFPNTGPRDERYFLTAVEDAPLSTNWRFGAVQFDKESRGDYLNFFLDGKMVSRSPITEINVTDIPASAFLQGTSFKFTSRDDHLPENLAAQNGNQVSHKVADVRLYSGLLTEMEIQDIHLNKTWTSGFKARQCGIPAVDEWYKDDGRWADLQGHKCDWYAERVKERSQVCSLKEARIHCGMSCKRFRECHAGSMLPSWVPPTATKPNTVFDRIMNLTPRKNASSASILCVRKSLDRNKVVSQCRNASKSNSDILRYQEKLSNVWFRVKRDDLSDCDVLEKQLKDTQCTWDDSWVKNFTSEAGEYSDNWKMSFTWWAKMTPSSRGYPDEFFSGYTFFGRLATPFVVFDAAPVNGYADASVILDGTREQFISSQAQAPKSQDGSGWTMYYTSIQHILNRNCVEYCIAVGAGEKSCECIPYYAPGTSFADHIAWSLLRPSPPEQFLEAIEFTNAQLVTPIEVSSKLLSTSELQKKFYTTLPKMQNLPGPRFTEAQKADAKEQVVQGRETGRFDEKIALAAPPLLFQTREDVAECPSDAMQLFIQKQRDLIKASHCWLPEMCANLESSTGVFSCTSSHNSAKPGNSTHFGLAMSTLDGEEGYADFLQTIAESVTLVRNGEKLEAREFIDGQTTQVKILCLFHLPNTADTVQLELGASSKGTVVGPYHRFAFYSFLQKDAQQSVITIFTLLFVIGFVTAVLNLVVLYFLWREKQRWHRWDMYAVGEVVYDLVQVAMVISFRSVTFEYRIHSERRAEDVIREFAEIPFADPTVSVRSKVGAFFAAVENLKDVLTFEFFLSSFGFALSIVMLIRIINATAVHPRTGVLTGTIWNGLNDLWHFTILFLVVFIFFAYTATFMFGSSRQDFGSLRVTMSTQFAMLLGEVPEDYQEEPTLIVYIVFTNVVVYFLMLNFLLAIVVEAYMKVRERIEEIKTENEITYDIVITGTNWLRHILSGWPSRRSLMMVCRHRIMTRNVSAWQLKMFGFHHKAARQICEYYHQFQVLRGGNHMNPYDRAILNMMGTVTGDLKDARAGDKAAIERLAGPSVAQRIMGDASDSQGAFVQHQAGLEEVVPAVHDIPPYQMVAASSMPHRQLDSGWLHKTLDRTEPPSATVHPSAVVQQTPPTTQHHQLQTWSPKSQAPPMASTRNPQNGTNSPSPANGAAHPHAGSGFHYAAPAKYPLVGGSPPPQNGYSRHQGVVGYPDVASSATESTSHANGGQLLHSQQSPRYGQQHTMSQYGQVLQQPYLVPDSLRQHQALHPPPPTGLWDDSHRV